MYVVEPHANAVFADAQLPDGFAPSPGRSDVEPEYPAEDRQQLLLFARRRADPPRSRSGRTPSPGGSPASSPARSWPLCLFLLARILFKRRLVAGLVALFVVVDGMLFVQSRIGMNDVYVGLFIIAAYTVFAAVWTGWWRGAARSGSRCRSSACCSASRSPRSGSRPMPSGRSVLLILVRSALGRVLAILGLIGITAVLGYLAITVPEGQGFGNLPFLVDHGRR